MKYRAQSTEHETQANRAQADTIEQGVLNVGFESRDPRRLDRKQTQAIDSSNTDDIIC